MLRITVTRHPTATALGLEGRLAGAWVEALDACWQELLAERRPLRVDLHCVTFVDAAGKALLRAMHERGAELAASECMTRAIVDEITGAGEPP